MEAARVTAGPCIHDADIVSPAPAAPASDAQAHGVDPQGTAAVRDERGDIDALHAAATDADAVELEVTHQIAQQHTVYIYSYRERGQ